jgi:Mor family transcriptional regulator
MRRKQGDYWSEKRKQLYKKNTKTERNAAILKDKAAGLSTVELVSKYKISQSRLFFIINQAKQKANA